MFGYHGTWQWPGFHPWPGYYYPYPFAFFPGPSVFGYGFAHCPVCGNPIHLCTCEAKTKVLWPREAMVDESSSPQSVVIGGVCDVKLTLEYMPVEGATSPAVQVSITDTGTTTSWAEPAIPDAYNVKSDFPEVGPGGKIALEVTDAIGRLRWCEVLEY